MKTLLLVLTLLPLFIFGQSLPPPTISHETGFYENEFDVEISHPDPDVTIFYTTDGSEPSLDNLTGKEWTYKKEYPSNPGDDFGELLKDTIWTYEYSGPILIKNRGDEQNFTSAIPTAVNTSYGPSGNVFKNTIVKTVAYFNGEYSDVITRTYFVHPQGVNRYSFPVFSVSVDNDKMYGYEEGLNVPGKLFDEWRQDNPTEPFSPTGPANYKAEGSSSEFKVHVSYIKEGMELVNHYAGIRLNGGWTRFYPNRAIRLYAKSGYGTSKFQVPFFEDYPFDDFKRIILRNSGNDAFLTMFRDAFIHNLVRNLNFDIQQYQPVILFINSEYDGVRNLRSKYDSKYFERVYNIDEDTLDYLDVNGEIKEGDGVYYNEMLDFFRNNSLVDNTTYLQALTYLDPINFTDYHITNIFAANYDWPHHNNRLWRKKITTFNPTAEYGHDGRFRWILKDIDFGFDLHNENEYKLNSVEWATRTIDPSEPNFTILDNSTLLLRGLLENEEYKNYFLNRFADLLNTTLATDRVLDNLNEFKSVYQPEIEENGSRWNHFSPQLNVWENHVDVMFSFAMNRSSYLKNHLIQKFELEGMYDLVLDVSDTTHGHIHLNTIDILSSTDGISANPYIWIGSYFKNVPITLKAIAKPGYVFSHWSGEINDTLPEITVNLSHDTYVKANFIPEDELSIEEIASTKESNGITVFPNPFNEYINILADSYDGNYTIYSATGQLVKEGVLSSQKNQLNDLEKGVYILKISSENTFYTHRIIKE